MLAVVATLLMLAAPDVTVYGASWCGPCQSLKAYLQQQRVAFDYVDVDAHRDHFEKVSPESGAIPLTIIGKERVRGARLQAIKTLLVQSKMVDGAPTVGEYGGFSAHEWQQQFQAMRKRVADLKTRLAKLEKETIDVEGRATILPRAKADLKIAQESLDDLEKAASDVALPRNFRAY